MKAKSIKGKTASDIQLALQQCIEGDDKKEQPGFKPTLAFVFLSNLDDIDEVSGILDKQGISIFGASTMEKFTDQGIEAEGIVVLLMDIKKENFRIILKDLEASPASAYQSACEVGQTAINNFAHPAFIISASDYRTPGEDIINGLLDTAGADVKVIGGMAGEAINFTGAVFTNKAKASNGLLVLVLDEEKVAVRGLAVSGWKPVGTEKTITSAQGAWVHTIDNEPAMDVIKKFLGKDIEVIEEANGLVPLNIGYPLQIKRDSGTPMMRPTLLWNTEDQSVMMGGLVKQGSTFRFSLPPDLDVIDTVIQSSREIKEKELPEAEAMLIFSCIGRQSSLGPLLLSEIEGLAETWNTPMAGFFSLGEFGKLDDSRTEFHGTTVSWVALKEK
jgi:hypothetical protein